MKFPESVKYTKEHEWVKTENNICTVGLTDYAQSELGDIIYLDINQDMGSDVNQGDTLGSIEAVKTVSEIYSPVSGKIAEVNVSINDNPSIVNTDPYGEGWIIKIELANASDLENLMSVSQYKEHIGES
jgi:glycine cleavage system H protein